MSTMNEIEQHTREYAERRGALAGAVDELNAAIEALKRKHLPLIKRRVAAAADAQAVLQAALNESRELFVKPKTQTFHGIKVGFKKGTGKIEFDDADKVVQRIRKHCEADVAELLIITTEKPSKDALGQQDAALLKKLGVTITEAGEYVVIAPADSNVDKLVKALLDNAVDEATEEAGA
jgi:hypothetical protein